MALIGALQPALVTVLAFFLIKEKTSMKGILGMLIGMLGLVLVLSPVFELDLSHGGVSLLTLLFACLGIFSLSLGVTYQKMSIASSDSVCFYGDTKLCRGCGDRRVLFG